MAAGNYDIFVEQGTTFTLYLNYKNTGGSSINLSGYTGEMQVRRVHQTSIASHWYWCHRRRFHWGVDSR